MAQYDTDDLPCPYADCSLRKADSNPGVVAAVSGGAAWEFMRCARGGCSDGALLLHCPACRAANHACAAHCRACGMAVEGRARASQRWHERKPVRRPLPTDHAPIEIAAGGPIADRGCLHGVLGRFLWFPTPHTACVCNPAATSSIVTTSLATIGAARPLAPGALGDHHFFVPSEGGLLAFDIASLAFPQAGGGISVQAVSLGAVPTAVVTLGDGVAVLAGEVLSVVSSPAAGAPEIVGVPHASDSGAELHPIDDDHVLVASESSAVVLRLERGRLSTVATADLTGTAPVTSWAARCTGKDTVCLDFVQDGELRRVIAREGVFGDPYPHGLARGVTGAQSVSHVAWMDADSFAVTTGIAVILDFQCLLSGHAGQASPVPPERIERIAVPPCPHGGYFLLPRREGGQEVASVYFADARTRLISTVGSTARIWGATFGFGSLAVMRSGRTSSTLRIYDLASHA